MGRGCYNVVMAVIMEGLVNTTTDNPTQSLLCNTCKDKLVVMNVCNRE